MQTMQRQIDWFTMQKHMSKFTQEGSIFPQKSVKIMPIPKIKDKSVRLYQRKIYGQCSNCKKAYLLDEFQECIDKAKQKKAELGGKTFQSIHNVNIHIVQQENGKKIYIKCGLCSLEIAEVLELQQKSIIQPIKKNFSVISIKYNRRSINTSIPNKRQRKSRLSTCKDIKCEMTKMLQYIDQFTMLVSYKIAALQRSKTQIKGFKNFALKYVKKHRPIDIVSNIDEQISNHKNLYSTAASLESRIYQNHKFKQYSSLQSLKSR